MYKHVLVQKISVGSVYKLWLVGLGSAMAPFGVLCGVLAMFGLNTVTVNRQPLHGVAGLVAGSLLGVMLPVLFTVFLGTATAFGLWLYSMFRPITLKVKMPFHSEGDKGTTLDSQGP